MRVETTFSAVSLLALAAATPTRTINKRATCGQWDSIQTGAYTVYNDLWGESGATSGSGCIAVNGISVNTLSWDSTWTWVGGNGVKSFPNAVVSLTPAPLSSISSMQSTWAWSYTGSNLVADVAYDIFTSSTATGSNEYEIMVWLAAYGGAGPISSSYGSDGNPVPIGSTTIAGYTFNLYKGPNGATTVYSFLPASGQITSFNGDIRQFFTYLISQGLISDSQYLTSVGAGSEPTTGSDATFAVSAYSITIATGGTVTSPSSATSRTTSTTSQVTSTTSTTHSTAKTFSTSPSTGSAVPHYGQCGGEGYSGSTVCAAPYTCTSFNAWYSQCV